MSPLSGHAILCKQGRWGRGALPRTYVSVVTVSSVGGKAEDKNFTTKLTEDKNIQSSDTLILKTCVSRALRGGSEKEEPLPKSTTLGAPPLPPRALQAAPGNDGLPPTQPPLGTPRQPMCDGSNPLSHPASGMARHSNPQAGVRTASGSHS